MKAIILDIALQAFFGIVGWRRVPWSGRWYWRRFGDVPGYSSGQKNSPDRLSISSRIEARSVGAGSGGFSRLVGPRIRRLMRLDHALHSVIRYTFVDGRKHELWWYMGFGETRIEGADRSNGECLTKPILTAWTENNSKTSFKIIIIIIVSHNSFSSKLYQCDSNHFMAIV